MTTVTKNKVVSLIYVVHNQRGEIFEYLDDMPTLQ